MDYVTSKGDSVILMGMNLLGCNIWLGIYCDSRSIAII